ncbi:Peptidyl-prolyl cis-trans isomerase A precursor [Gimesia alba]|uniref:Peptidyl-prolyl cis-trans isomerase n=1 Tax=Gimesia alba TaxID=2527973 RepID=A0A517R972_9PLAN|nr:peptidylprolyl isomerase [Gimesia alba]QDT40401.1 Peptidyl-prolyl cis-trans isomerase A precursor [Gimesia alba]
MSRFTLFALCLVAVNFVGCNSETPTGGDAEVPEAASKGGTSTTSADDYQVLLKTTKGDVLLEVHPEWSPKGAARFKELVELGFYDNCAFFRVLDGFMAQVGINGDPALHAKWRDNNIPDDPVVESNKRGYVSFANAGPDTRSTQFFINYGDNSNLDYGFSPFAKVIEGMEVVDSLYNGYGEGAPSGPGPSQGRIVGEGNAYLKKEFPMLDYIVKATIVEEEPAKTDAKSETAEPEAKDDKQPAEPAAEKSEKKEAADDKPKEAAAKKDE